VLRIDGIESIEESRIGEKELLAAGYQNRESFCKEVLIRSEGHLYKISFHFEEKIQESPFETGLTFCKERFRRSRSD